jgi:hypothetical protein
VLLTPIGATVQSCMVPLHNPNLTLAEASERRVPTDDDLLAPVCGQAAVGYLNSEGGELIVCPTHAVMAVGYDRTEEVCRANAETYRAVRKDK